jgi:hypothetical protein
MRLSKPSPATAIACAALFVALGGTAAAAGGYLITSTSQIKPNVLKSIAATSPGSEVEVVGPEVSLRPGQPIAATIAECPRAGALSSSRLTSPKAYHVVAGGYVADLGAGAFVYRDAPHAGTGWTIWIDNLNSTAASHARAFALCAPGSVSYAGAAPWSLR